MLVKIVIYSNFNVSRVESKFVDALELILDSEFDKRTMLFMTR